MGRGSHARFLGVINFADLFREKKNQKNFLLLTRIATCNVAEMINERLLSI